MSFSKSDIAEAKKNLSGEGYIGIKEGQDIYTLIRKVTGSGTRYLDVFIVGKDNTIWRITWSVASATEMSYDRKNEAIKVSGYGFDAGFEIVYNLSMTLFGNGYVLKHRSLS